MNLWGILLCLCGLGLFWGGMTKSKFMLYLLLVARSRILWKDHVHTFHQVSGILMIVFGLAVTFRVI